MSGCVGVRRGGRGVFTMRPREGRREDERRTTVTDSLDCFLSGFFFSNLCNSIVFFFSIFVSFLFLFSLLSHLTSDGASAIRQTNILPVSRSVL